MKKYNDEANVNFDKIKALFNDKMHKFDNEIKFFINKIDED